MGYNMKCPIPFIMKKEAEDPMDYGFSAQDFNKD